MQIVLELTDKQIKALLATNIIKRFHAWAGLEDIITHKLKGTTKEEN